MVVVLVLAVLLLGFGGGFGVGRQSKPDSSVQGPPGSTLPAGCVPTRTVEVLGTWTGAEQNNFQRVIDKFEQTSGIDVHYAFAGREIAEALDADQVKRNPPDVAILPQPGLLQKLASDDRLQPIDDLTRDVEQNFRKTWLDLGRGQDGNLYGVWFKVNNKSTIWFQTNSLSRSEAREVNTWSELLEAAGRLQEAGRTPFSVAGSEGDAWTLTDWFENVYLRTAGSDNYDRLTRHDIEWTHETVIVALRTLAELFSKPEWLTGGTDGTLNTDFPTSVARVFETPRQAAMVYEGDFTTAFIDDTAIANADFFPFPDFPYINALVPRSVIVGGNVAVLLKPQNQQENCGAKELIRALTTADAVEPWAAIGGGFSTANANLVPRLPSEPARRAAGQLLTQDIVFDLSDQQPPIFGASPGKGMYQILREFLRNPANIEGTADKLEAARDTAD